MIRSRCSRMERLLPRTLIAGLVTLSAAVGDPGEARANSTADLCHAAAAAAARETDVPLNVLSAIMLTETGRSLDGRLQPWPWTINTGEDGHWFPDRQTALRFAEDLLRAGRTSFDIGCFQINFRWHGSAFTSLEDMFDPARNARYAADFLSSLAEESGEWSVAAGAYHSRTPALAERYRARFDTILAEIGAIAPVQPSPDTGSRGYDHPLLQARDGARTPGSLVPLSLDPST